MVVVTTVVVGARVVVEAAVVTGAFVIGTFTPRPEKVFVKGILSLLSASLVLRLHVLVNANHVHAAQPAVLPQRLQHSEKPVAETDKKVALL